MHVTMGHDDPGMMEAAILHLLARSYPAHFSDQDVVSQLSRDPDSGKEDFCVTDALRQLQADRLVRKHGRYWAASLVAVKAYALLEG